jgi:hypothetical protein
VPTANISEIRQADPAGAIQTAFRKAMVVEQTMTVPPGIRFANNGKANQLAVAGLSAMVRAGDSEASKCFTGAALSRADNEL